MQWRSKVFELMVQCKTQEIIAKEDEYKNTLIVKEFNRQIKGISCDNSDTMRWSIEISRPHQ